MRKLRRVLAPSAVLAMLVIPGAFAPAASAAAPSVSTTAATAVSDTGATANGTVNPNGQPTFYAFQWGPTAGYGHETPLASSGGATQAQAVNAALTGLNPGTAYHFRVIAMNADGTSVGNDQTVTTTGTAPAPSPPPVVATLPASSVGQSGATLHGTVNPAGQATSYVFEYGKTTDYGVQTAPVSAGTGAAPVAASAAITGLDSGATYHYRIVGYSAGGTTLGSDMTITTTVPPGAKTGGASGIASDSAIVNGTVSPAGHSTSYQFQFGTTTAYGLTTPPAGAGSSTSSVAVHQTLAGLAPGTTYHYRIVTSSSQGIGYGDDRTFTTAGGAASTSRIAILGRIGFVAPRGGFVGVVLDCIGGGTRCMGNFTFTRDGVTYATGRFNLAPESGGFQNVRLSRASQRALFRHYHGPVAVELNVMTNDGQSISQLLHLARWH